METVQKMVKEAVRPFPFSINAVFTFGFRKVWLKGSGSCRILM